ncbi:MAG: hypothetical protein ACI86H_000241 [bacterium]|jgi:hypothetical protein
MSDISRRLKRIADSIAGKQLEELEKLFNSGMSQIDERLAEWEKKLGILEDKRKSSSSKQKSSSSSDQSNQKNSQHTYSTSDTQLKEDLANFGLYIGATWPEIKKARNREMKKFHADLYANNPEKLETAQKIMQIYNASYERLKKKYNK